VKITTHAPVLTMRFLDDADDPADLPVYHGCLQWTLTELSDGTVMASSSCWHADRLGRRAMVDAVKVLYHQHRVRRVRTLRPRHKWVPRWRHLVEGAYTGFSELVLPDDLPEVLDDAG
jgi:hypothetical protein